MGVVPEKESAHDGGPGEPLTVVDIEDKEFATCFEMDQTRTEVYCFLRLSKNRTVPYGIVGCRSVH